MKVDEQAQLLIHHSQIRQHLRSMNWVDDFDGFQFDDNSIVDEQVQSVEPVQN